MLEDFTETVEDEVDRPLVCPVPPISDAGVHPAVSESIGIRAAYERHFARTGRTLVGRVVDADGIPDAVNTLVALAEGLDVKNLECKTEQFADLAMDVRAYFEEAAAELAGHTPAARAAESWLFRQTHTGHVVRNARNRLADAGYPRLIWWGMSPISQETPDEAERLWRMARTE